MENRQHNNNFKHNTEIGKFPMGDVTSLMISRHPFSRRISVRYRPCPPHTLPRLPGQIREIWVRKVLFGRKKFSPQHKYSLAFSNVPLYPSNHLNVIIPLFPLHLPCSNTSPFQIETLFVKLLETM